MEWQSILQPIVFISLATLGLLVVARIINQFVMSIHLTEALVQKDNPAVGIQIAGYVFAVFVVIGSVLTGSGTGKVMTDAILVTIYGVAGIILLGLISSASMNLLLEAGASESIRTGNVAAGITAAGSYVASGCVIAACVAGDAEGGNALTSLIFLVLGQASLLLITYIFRLLTSYDDVKEILNGNIPAALSYAGVMIAVGLIVGHAVEGDFVDYSKSFLAFGKALAAVIALYPIRQFLVQGLLLGSGFRLYGGELDREISQDRNINAGIIEAISYIGAALLIVNVG
jgi:uncharacterized membrane protein YjfL (UPF0719 family)